MNDGGPAFPAIIPFEHSDQQGKDYPNYGESGMTLRDWFAGQALIGMLAGRLPSGSDTYLASKAYTIADAMLKEREAPHK